MRSSSWCREISVAGPTVQEQRKYRNCLPLPRAEVCRVRVVAEATERAPEERKYRRCVAFQKRTLDLDGSTTKVMEGILGSTQRDARKRGVKVTWPTGWLSFCLFASACVGWFAFLVLAMWAALALGVVAFVCCRVLSSGPVILGFGPQGTVFSLLLRKSDDPRTDLSASIPSRGSTGVWYW